MHRVSYQVDAQEIGEVELDVKQKYKGKGIREMQWILSELEMKHIGKGSELLY
jgi:hypothetical protein